MPHAFRTAQVYRAAPVPHQVQEHAPGQGQQGLATCAVCGHETTVKKADAGSDAPRHAPVHSQHRQDTGGRVYLRRGDVPCPGSNRPI